MGHAFYPSKRNGKNRISIAPIRNPAQQFTAYNSDMVMVGTESLASASTVESPETLGPGVRSGGGWVVTVYDNDFNTVDEVMAVLLIATECTPDEAYIETWEVHNLGASVVHHSSEEECRRVAAIIATIGIRVEVSEEC